MVKKLLKHRKRGFLYRRHSNKTIIKEMRECKTCDNKKMHFHSFKIKHRNRINRVYRYYPQKISYKFVQQAVILNEDWIANLIMA